MILLIHLILFSLITGPGEKIKTKDEYGPCRQGFLEGLDELLSLCPLTSNNDRRLESWHLLCRDSDLLDVGSFSVKEGWDRLIPDEARGSIVDVAVNLSAHSTHNPRFRPLSRKMYLETNESINSKIFFQQRRTHVVDVRTASLVA